MLRWWYFEGFNLDLLAKVELHVGVAWRFSGVADCRPGEYVLNEVVVILVVGATVSEESIRF